MLLGPAFSFSDILHLLHTYQGIVSARPIEIGNRSFLDCLLVAARRLGEALDNAPGKANFSNSEVSSLLAHLRSQTPANAKEIAGHLLKAISELQNRYGLDGKSPHLYIRGPLPPLRSDYSTVTVVFGPALGLGDQITFLQLLRFLARHCQKAQMTIFTLYPNLWKYLIPQIREFHYRERPLRPFLYLAMNRRYEREEAPELVVIADFECFDFHRKVISQKPGRDILEIALGRRAAWLNEWGSPWLRFEDFSSSAPVGNNYWVLAKMAERLLPGSNSPLPWEPIEHRNVHEHHRQQKVLFLNPFTSKRFPLQPQDWYRVLQRVQADLSPKVELQVLVHPGLNPASRSYATEICRLSAGGQKPITARLLAGKNGAPLTPYGTFPCLVSAFQEVDLCLTVDTFSAHFAPLFRIPTVVVTDRDNREFWVPSRWSFYCLLDRMDRALPDLLSHLLTILSSTEEGMEELRQAARGLVSATATASEVGVTLDVIGEMQRTLAQILQESKAAFPYRGQAQEWLLLWSRLSAALHREPVDTCALQPYLFRWKESEFFKLLALTLRDMENNTVPQC